MAQKRIVSHVRTHRKKSGLTQRELARLLGYRHSGRVSRHERGITVPTLSAALAYQTIFRVPIAELFPAIHEMVTESTETRLAALQSVLGKKSAKDHDANRTARKLQFIYERNDSAEI